MRAHARAMRPRRDKETITSIVPVTTTGTAE
jgi:hypothetical protein